MFVDRLEAPLLKDGKLREKNEEQRRSQGVLEQDAQQASDEGVAASEGAQTQADHPFTGKKGNPGHGKELIEDKSAQD